MRLTPADYLTLVADLTTQAESPGLLLVVPDGFRPANVMTVGWVLFGRVWERPMCMVMVRPSRYTFDLINCSGVFSLNRMPDGFDEEIAHCGSVSGRDVDKIAELGWTTREGESLPAPFLVEAQSHFECRTVFTAEVNEALAPSLRTGFYSDGDLHMCYFAQVRGAYRHE